MKVGIVINTLKIGGTEKQAVLLLKALNGLHDVDLIILNGNLIDNKFIKKFNVANKYLIAIEGNILKKFFMLYKYLKNKKYDFVFSFLTMPNLLSGICSRIIGIKHFYSSIRSTYLPIWKIILEVIIARYFSKKTIFNSYKAMEKFKAAGINNGILLNNCVEEVFEPIERPKKDKITIISVGRLTKEKDYFTALKSIHELSKFEKKFNYIIIGYGVLENKLIRVINDLNLTNFVRIVKSEDVYKYLFDADIYLSTSVHEGTSNSLLEAMNASLPIICTNVGDNNMIVKNGLNGYLVSPKDYIQITNFLTDLIKDYEKRIRFGLFSNQIIKSQFSFNMFKLNYLKLLNEP